MNTYKISNSRTVYYEYIIHATSEEEARELVLSAEPTSEQWDDYGTDVVVWVAEHTIKIEGKQQ
jgi:hypothetical protein